MTVKHDLRKELNQVRAMLDTFAEKLRDLNYKIDEIPGDKEALTLLHNQGWSYSSIECNHASNNDNGKFWDDHNDCWSDIPPEEKNYY